MRHKGDFKEENERPEDRPTNLDERHEAAVAHALTKTASPRPGLASSR